MRIYIAGPLSPRGIRSDTNNGAIEYVLNVRDMVRAATELIKKGHSPFCPGLDFLYFIGALTGNEPTEVEIKAQDLEWLEVSDAIYLLPGSDQSLGAVQEYCMALSRGLQIFRNMSEIPEVKEGFE